MTRLAENAEQTGRDDSEPSGRISLSGSAPAAGRAPSIAIGFATRAVNAGFSTHWYQAAVFDGILRASRLLGYDLVLFNGHPSDDVDRSVAVYRERCSGILHFSYELAPEIQHALGAAGLPVVGLGGPSPAGGNAYVDIDNAKAARDVTNHLLALGHRRLAMFLGDDCEMSHQRLGGFLQAHEEAGVMRPDPDLIVPGSHTLPTGAQRARAVFARPRDEWPTGIVCFNDHIALGVLTVTTEMGIRVPEDISVAGIDDLIESRVSRPSLTTVRQPLRDIGERGVELLVEIIAGTSPPWTQVHLPHELIVRGSTAPPRH